MEKLLRVIMLFMVHQQLPFSSLISKKYGQIEIQFVFEEDLRLTNTKQPLAFDLI